MIQQKTEKWYNERYNMLTASDVSTILGMNNYKTAMDIIDLKIKKERAESINFDWGNKYEEIVKTECLDIIGQSVEDMGLVKHKHIKWLGASPDGLLQNGYLIEIKCPIKRKIVKGFIPNNYWVQVQIQLEVTDKKYCEYHEFSFVENATDNNVLATGFFKENDKNVDWYLIDHQKIIIKRDKKWFGKIFRKLELFWSDLQFLKKKSKKRKLEDKNNERNKRIKLYNFNIAGKITYSNIRNYMVGDTVTNWLEIHGEKNGYEKDNKCLSVDFFKMQKLMFHCKILAYLENAFPNEVKIIVNPYERNKVSYYHVEETENEMKDNTPIIYGAVFNNDVEYCVFDLLIKKSYLGKLLNKDTRLNLNDKYINVLIEYKTIRIVNGIVSPKNKENIHIYTKYLFMNRLFKSKCRIIGRSYQIKKDKINNCFSIIPPLTKNKELKNKVNDAIKYLSKEIDYNNVSINMSNNTWWSNAKKKIALEKKAMSLVWNCTNVTASYRDNGVKKYIKNCRNADLVEKIIDINNSEDKYSFVRNIQLEEEKLEIFVDMETINNTLDDFSEFPLVKDKPLIYLIGMAWVYKGKWNYEYFTWNTISANEEIRIINEWFNKIEELEKKTGINHPRVFHWSNAEKTFLNKSIAKYNLELPELNWVDLMDVFKENQIVINGLFNYKLKNVVSTLYENDEIKVNYNGELQNGLVAMVLYWRCYLDSIETGKQMVDYEVMNKIIKYNKIDCQVLFEILGFLRKNNMV